MKPRLATQITFQTNLEYVFSQVRIIDQFLQISHQDLESLQAFKCSVIYTVIYTMRIACVDFTHIPLQIIQKCKEQNRNSPNSLMML